MDEILSLTSRCGMTIICSSVGAGLVDIQVPDRKGRIESVLVRPQKYSQYYRASGSFGKPCGRTAGRISPKTFTLEGKSYTIETGNDKTFALHGGVEGISSKAFTVHKEIHDGADGYSSLVFTYVSKDGEGGYPGNLTIKISYDLFDEGYRLRIRHEADTDQTTLCNLTCHAYFNLSGNDRRKVLDHTLMVAASKRGVVNENTVATELRDVEKIYDWRKAHKIGDFIEDPDIQWTTLGYDLPYVLDEVNPEKVQACLYDKESGRKLEVLTSYGSMVLYTCNHPSEYICQNGLEIGKYDGCCLEMQHFPNTVNSPFIKDKLDVLTPERHYDEFIEYRFSVE
jgi:aldose 1-epimerase